MSINEAFKTIFSDRDWAKKLGLGALVSLIPYVGAVTMLGYSLRHLRDIAWDRAQELPVWKAWIEYLKTGFFAMLVGIVYALPITLIITFVVVVTIALGTVGLRQSGSPAALILMAVVLFFVSGALSLLSQLVLWPAYTQVALYDTLQSGFDFKGIYARAKSNAPAYWQAARATLLLSGASLLIMGVLWGGWLALFGAALFGISSDASPIGMLLVLPAEFVMLALTMLISVPVQIATSHIWGGYARSAYDLENPTVTEAEIQAEYAPEPLPDYLPPAPVQ